jgi:hypothetical protein
LRADEAEREGGDYASVLDVQMRFPMREWGLSDVRAYLSSRNQSIPTRTDCNLCFFQTLTEWWNLWKDDPEAYAQGEAYEAMTGHTFRSDGRDSQPASLKSLRQKFEAGYRPAKAGQGDLFRSMTCRVCRI